MPQVRSVRSGQPSGSSRSAALPRAVAASAARRLVAYHAPCSGLQARTQLTALGSGRQRVSAWVYSGLKCLARFGGVAGYIDHSDEYSGR
jgi:hypothetical protein